MSFPALTWERETRNKTTSPSRCVGTRHQRYLGQTDNINRAVSTGGRTSRMSFPALTWERETRNKTTSPSRCVGTRHERYLGQTDNINRAVSRLMIMGNLKDMI